MALPLLPHEAPLRSNWLWHHRVFIRDTLSGELIASAVLNSTVQISSTGWFRVFIPPDGSDRLCDVEVSLGQQGPPGTGDSTALQLAWAWLTATAPLAVNGTAQYQTYQQSSSAGRHIDSARDLTLRPKLEQAMAWQLRSSTRRAVCLACSTLQRTLRSPGSRRHSARCDGSSRHLSQSSCGSCVAAV